MNLRHHLIIVELKKKKSLLNLHQDCQEQLHPHPSFSPQLRNVAANLCVDSKHGATGTELRLDVCVKDGSERTWSHEQVARDQAGITQLSRP